jgi:hypothetical protein
MEVPKEFKAVPFEVVDPTSLLLKFGSGILIICELTEKLKIKMARNKERFFIIKMFYSVNLTFNTIHC